ncbi:MAG TPA: TPM domain-containing protein, partial [Pyrinomonadaceae bacterium]|nr:TPM domain-containing protein [Pyrinomonadaceae bacterium]
MNRRLSTTPAALVVFVCLLAAAGLARAQGQSRAYSESPLPRPTGYVSDTANVIDAATEQRLEALLTELKTAGDIEFAVVTVPTTGDTPIFDYTLSVARGWGIGSKEAQSKGAILLVAVNDRKYFMQVSRHLEGDLPDGLIGEILRQKLREPFRAGDYGRGVTDAVETFAATLAQKQGFTLSGAGQEQAYRPPVRQTREPRARTRQGGGLGFGACCCLAAVVGLLLLSL